jgi:hypothetical protein
MLLVTQARNFSPVLEAKGSLPFLQEPATGRYPEPRQSNPHPHTIFPEPF